MANDEVAFQNETGCGPRLRRIGRSICNLEKGTFLSRTPGSWAKITVFYLVFYSCLAGFFAAMLVGFFTTIDPKYPTQRKMYSLLKANPGMGFKPRPKSETTLIKFNSETPKTYKDYVKDINDYMKEYNKTQNGTVVNCDGGTNNSTEDTVCQVRPDDIYGPCVSSNDYGFSNKTPCVLLKINKVFDWMPEAFGSDNSTDTEDQSLRRKQATVLLKTLSTDHVSVTCQGENIADMDLLGDVPIWPSNGIPFNWFPYENQLGYRVPIVFAQFTNFKKGQLIQVWCKMWAKNIKHHKNDKAGSVHFELLID